ncbi:iron-containing alcohol dehydrogenase [Moritella sp. 5]|uniref:iron-containing alcohol dehydrogenase n=1 Tax=Moritella sp. 5 TaxID=2746231 RepID=UPI001BAC4739|nr:iron-containing alcohol dehydrogenase [Moritella sp. 5]QUM81235.1 iron-containing alcohol dehydrogenase [Moritella sp. 5]
MELNQFTANWHYPTAIRTGIGRIKELPATCQELGMKSPLLITDPGLADLAIVQAALANCQQAGLRCGIFSQIKGNPTGENVTDGVSAYWRGEHDGVIAFGGGSALDAAKAVALMVGQDRPLWDFEDVGDNWLNVHTESMAPVVAVPTTSGTGSEVGRASVITDSEHHIKRIIFHPNMLPAVVILDPQLSVGLPAALTATTGMDALSHALEAYCANAYHPMAEGIALEAIRLIKEYLPRAVENGQDLEARMQMMAASTMGSTAFQRGLGGMHALAHPIGALYDSHHGLVNAILMPYVLKANRTAIEVKLTRLSRYLELEESDFDSFIDWVLTLRKQLDIPHSLGEIGIDAERVIEIGIMAAKDPSAGSNPIKLDAQQYADIYLSAIHGDLYV